MIVKSKNKNCFPKIVFLLNTAAVNEPSLLELFEAYTFICLVPPYGTSNEPKSL